LRFVDVVVDGVVVGGVVVDGVVGFAMVWTWVRAWCCWWW
jgi:hypothetical protein